MTATLSLELPAERRVGHRRHRVPAHPPRPRVRCHRNPENTRSRQKPAWRPLSAPSGTRIPCRVRVSACGRLRTWWDHEFYVNGNPLNFNDPTGHRPGCDNSADCYYVNQAYAHGPGLESNQLAAGQAEINSENAYLLEQVARQVSQANNAFNKARNCIDYNLDSGDIACGGFGHRQQIGIPGGDYAYEDVWKAPGGAVLVCDPRSQACYVTASTDVYANGTTTSAGFIQQVQRPDNRNAVAAAIDSLAVPALAGIAGAAPGEEPNAQDLVPGGGLAAHEAAGGHTLELHVDQLDSDLLARLANYPKISGASTFTNRASAESALSDLLADNQNDIQSWLAGCGNKLVLNGSAGDLIGRYVAQGSSEILDVSGIRAVLLRSPSLGIGYFIRTAFPTP